MPQKLVTESFFVVQVQMELNSSKSDMKSNAKFQKFRKLQSVQVWLKRFRSIERYGVKMKRFFFKTEDKM